MLRADIEFLLYFYSMLCSMALADAFSPDQSRGQGFYHCLSRTVEGRFIFQSSGAGCLEAQKFVAAWRLSAAFGS